MPKSTTNNSLDKSLNKRMKNIKNQNKKLQIQ